METKPSQNPEPPPPPAKDQRDFLLHLEAYLAKRDGVDKLLKISRYATKIILASTLADSLSVAPRLKAFESSVGVSRKAFRLGKFAQVLNALRSSAVRSQSAGDRILSLIAYGGEGIYYFVEQFVWLTKAGLISEEHSKTLQKISAWAELVGYVGSIALKAGELRRIQSSLQSRVGNRKSTDGDRMAEDDDEVRKLQDKLFLKQLSIVQDFADGLMAIEDVRDGKGFLSRPLLLASAGLLSALISTHKNWSSC